MKVSHKLEKNCIDYCLIGGSLLGAVKQKAFAGRLSDFDIAVKERDWQKVLLVKPQLLVLRLKIKDHTSIIDVFFDIKSATTIPTISRQAKRAVA